MPRASIPAKAFGPEPTCDMDYDWNKDGGGPSPCRASVLTPWAGLTTPLIKDNGDDPETLLCS